jgi:hypothetical protein
MSLNYNLADIEDFKTVCLKPDGTISALTEALVFSTLIVELGEITEENVGEWYARLTLCKGLGKLTHRRLNEAGEAEDIMPTVEELIAHIGLKTNVSSVHRQRWLTRSHGQVMGALDDIARRAQKVLDDEPSRP